MGKLDKPVTTYRASYKLDLEQWKLWADYYALPWWKRLFKTRPNRGGDRDK